MRLVKEQTNPPTIPVSELVPDKVFFHGEEMEHPPDRDGLVNYRIYSIDD